MQAKLVAIVGPTASGKSALALELARLRNGEIVSCDSLQVYRGLDIGSAKPSAAERAEVPHHLIDVVDPEEAFSAAQYAGAARAVLSEIRDRGHLPIIVGGTGLYLKALVVGLFEGPGADAALRKRLENLAPARMYRLLGKVDPSAAHRVHPEDRVRVVRALEVFFSTRKPLSHHHLEGKTEPLQGFETRVFGLSLSRELLRKRVAARTAAMFERGLMDEVARLLSRPLGKALRPLNAIGYRQAVAVLEKTRSVAEAERDIVTETMRYAKRQMTWFRHQPPPVVFSSQKDEILEQALRFLDPP